MRFCKNCTHFMVKTSPRPADMIYCEASGVRGAMYPVTGQLEYQYAYAYRRIGERCGPEGLGFTKK